MTGENRIITQELADLLRSRGADLVAAGNMAGVENCAYRIGVAVAVALPRHVVRDLQTAPTREYFELYHALNNRLNNIVLAGEEFLRQRGHEAWAQTTDRVKPNNDKISPLPHKTVATRAGLGWIGKNCLLVTPQYGSAIRLSSLLTDAPLAFSEAISASRCGKCDACVRNCPAGALAGTLWQAGTARSRILDYLKCYAKQLEIMSKNTGIAVDLCGKCFAACKHTQGYLGNAKPENRPDSREIA